MTAGGIVLPDAVAESQRPARGVVIDTGPLCDEIEVGDLVVFMMYAGSFLEDPDEKAKRQAEKDKLVYRIVREQEIFGVWKADKWCYREPDLEDESTDEDEQELG